MEAILENVSKFLGKPVVSIFNGNFEGYVKNILANKKLEKICYIELFLKCFRIL